MATTKNKLKEITENMHGMRLLFMCVFFFIKFSSVVKIFRYIHTCMCIPKLKNVHSFSVFFLKF